MSKLLYPILLVISLTPWLLLQLQLRPPGDASFLFLGAEHLLQGHRMVDYYFDNNPPMSFLIYIPAVILKIFGAPKYMAITIYTILLIMLSVAATAYSLTRIKNISTEIQQTILAAFLFSTTLLCSVEFGQKDHFIILGLTPFLIMQYLITQKISLPSPIKTITLFFCLPFILIKPHFGLLPTAIILYRAITQKRISVIFDSDFIALAIGVITYISYTFFFMPDYIQEILPISIELYASTDTLVTLTPLLNGSIFLLACMSICALSYLSEIQKETKKITLFISIMASLSVIPFIVQGKGFSLHLIPTFSLLFIAVSLLMLHVLKSRAVTTLTIMCVTSYSYAYASQNKFITHNEYLNSSIIKEIKTKADGQSYFIEYASTSPQFITSMYVDNTVASRFSSMWPINGALHIKNKDEKIRILNQFGNYIAKDFELRKPKLIILPVIKDGKSQLEIIYRNHPEIQKQLKKYSYKNSITITEYNALYSDFHVLQNTDKKTIELKLYIKDN